jgi:hypothetical protein
MFVSGALSAVDSIVYGVYESLDEAKNVLSEISKKVATE